MNRMFETTRQRCAFAAIAAALLAMVLGGCAGQDQEPGSPVSDGTIAATVISAEEAHEMMAAGDAVVLDVRTQEEYDGGHVPGAVLLPHDAITEESALAAAPEKDQVVLVYCRSGRRSAEAAEKLVELGYTQVYDFGGIQSWSYDVVTD